MNNAPALATKTPASRPTRDEVILSSELAAAKDEIAELRQALVSANKTIGLLADVANDYAAKAGYASYGEAADLAAPIPARKVAAR